MNDNNRKLKTAYVFSFRATINLHRYLDHAKHADN